MGILIMLWKEFLFLRLATAVFLVAIIVSVVTEGICWSTLLSITIAFTFIALFMSTIFFIGCGVLLLGNRS